MEGRTDPVAASVVGWEDILRGCCDWLVCKDW
jgi:hypothetical protein